MLNQNFSRSLIELLPREIIRAILANSEDPEELSQVEILSYLPPRMREEIARSLPEDRLRAIPHEWGWLARRKQKPPPGDWRTWLVLAGRGFGKTRTGAEWVRGQVEAGRTRIALVGPTAADVRDVMVESESGVLAVRPPASRPRYEPSKRRITWPNGAIATTFSADEPERLRGPQHEAAWCEAGKLAVSRRLGHADVRTAAWR